jgi:hypothetical protein
VAGQLYVPVAGLLMKKPTCINWIGNFVVFSPYLDILEEQQTVTLAGNKTKISSVLQSIA